MCHLPTPHFLQHETILVRLLPEALDQLTDRMLAGCVGLAVAPRAPRHATPQPATAANHDTVFTTMCTYFWVRFSAWRRMLIYGKLCRACGTIDEDLRVQQLAYS